MQYSNSRHFALNTAIFSAAFSYYGIMVSLALLLPHYFHYSHSHTYELYGAFIGLGFSLPVLGGLIADRYLGKTPALQIGLILFVVGNACLFFMNETSLHIGLAFIAFGVGLVKPTCSSLMGSLSVEKRGTNFTWFYMSLNLGAMLGIIIYGIAASSTHYQWIFFLSGIFCLASFITCVATLDNIFKKQQLIGDTALVLASLIIGLLLTQLTLFNYIYIIFYCILLLVFLFYVYKMPVLLKKRIGLVFLMYLFVLLFFSATLQTGSSMEVFIKEHVNHTFFNVTIPVTVYTSLYPAFVILLAPALIYLAKKTHKRISLPLRFPLALFSAGIGFLLLTLTTFITQHAVLPSVVIIFTYFFMSLGEITIMPSVLTFASDTVPENHLSTIIGALFLFIAFGGYLSGFIASHITGSFTHLFLFITLYLFIIGTLLLSVKKRLG